MPNNALNLQEIDTEAAIQLCRFFIKAQQNVCFFGRRGIGKSFISLQVPAELRLKVNYLNLSLIDRSDLLGYANMFEPGEILTFKSPHYLPLLKEGEKPDQILLLDEIDKCEREIMGPLHELLQFRTINGKRTTISSVIATGNLPNEGAFSNSISSALLDRCAKYVLTFDLERWLIWGRANGIHDLVLGFLSANPQWACGKIETDDAFASPSPRGWTLASEALIRAKTLKIVDVATITNIISGYVGFEAGLHFRIWFEHFRSFEGPILGLIESGSCSLNYQELTSTEKLVFVVSACNLTKLRFVSESKSKPQYQYVERLCRFLVEQNVSLENMALALSNSFPIDLVVSPKHKLYNCKSFFELSSKISLPTRKL